MRNISRCILLIGLSVFAHHGWGHGFNISVNSYDGPTSLGVASQSQVFDNMFASLAPQNMFIEEFSAFPTSGTLGTYYSVLHGFCATSGAMPTYTATFNVVSPLYYSNGVGCGVNHSGPVVAQPASSGTFLNIYDLYAGNPDPMTAPHPGASFGNVIVTGTTSLASGFGVSLYDPHELEHDLYLSSTSAQTYGEYGFAYTVTMYFPNTGATLTTVPLVDIYALSAQKLGDFPDNASYQQQDAASVAIFQAATRSAPPSWAMAQSGSWTGLSNWTNWPGNGTAGSPPFGAGVQVAINAATASALTITLDNPQTIGALILGNSASNRAGYTIAAGSAGTLTLNNLTAGARIFVTGGSNAISANTILADNLTITPSAGTTLAISGDVSESTPGESLALAGPGTMVLSGSNTYTGGTIITAGTLELESGAAIEPGTSLLVGACSALLSNDASAASATSSSISAASVPTAMSVPEPGTLILGIIGGLLMLLRCQRFKRSGERRSKRVADFSQK